MEKNHSPWYVPEDGPVAALEFQDTTLRELQLQIKTFAKANDITDEIDAHSSLIKKSPNEGNFELLRTYLRDTVTTANAMLTQQRKNFLFLIDDTSSQITVTTL